MSTTFFAFFVFYFIVGWSVDVVCMIFLYVNIFKYMYEDNVFFHLK